VGPLAKIFTSEDTYGSAAGAGRDPDPQRLASENHRPLTDPKYPDCVTYTGCPAAYPVVWWNCPTASTPKRTMRVSTTPTPSCPSCSAFRLCKRSGPRGCPSGSTVKAITLRFNSSRCSGPLSVLPVGRGGSGARGLLSIWLRQRGWRMAYQPQPRGGRDWWRGGMSRFDSKVSHLSM